MSVIITGVVLAALNILFVLYMVMWAKRVRRLYDKYHKKDRDSI